MPSWDRNLYINTKNKAYTVCPGSSDSFYIVSY